MPNKRQKIERQVEFFVFSEFELIEIVGTDGHFQSNTKLIVEIHAPGIVSPPAESDKKSGAYCQNLHVRVRPLNY